MRDTLLILASLAISLTGCQSMTPISSKAIPFRYAGSHLLRIPVTINDSIQTHFILDTGIGVNLLSRSLADRLQCKVMSRYTGKRMSGQELTVPMSQIQSLSLGPNRQSDVQVGIWEMRGFLPEGADFEGVEGFLSLNFFRNQPFTMDYQNGRLILEDDSSLAARLSRGVEFPLILQDDGTNLCIFLNLDLPGGPPIRVELDLGGNILTLNSRLMKRLGVDPESPAVLQERRQDETGFDYLRYFTKIQGPLTLGAFQQSDLSVMFQDIIYDGLVGNDFMKRFVVTYDLAKARLIFQRPR